jgi:hypothetical protein
LVVGIFHGTTLPDVLPSVIPLTVKERELKERLEAIVQEGFGAFVRTAEALSELRRRRLWRTEAASWEEYA